MTGTCGSAGGVTSKRAMKKLTFNALTLKRVEGSENAYRCGRCKGVQYASREEQRAHWKVHKHSCKAPDLTIITEPYAGNCHEEELKRTLNRFHFAVRCDEGFENCALLILRIEDLLSQAEVDVGDFAVRMHGFARSLYSKSTLFWEKFWAIPFMTQILMDGNSRLHNLMCKVALQAGYVTGEVPSDEYCSALLSAAESEKVDQIIRLQTWGASAQYNFCFLYINLLAASAVQLGTVSSMSCHDGRGTLRTGIVGETATSRVLELYFDPLVQKSCGDALGPCASLCLTAMTAMRNDVTPKMSGVAVYTALSDIENRAFSSKYSKEIVKFALAIHDTEMGGFFCDVSVPMRARLAITAKGMWGQDWGMPNKILLQIVSAAMFDREKSVTNEIFDAIIKGQSAFAVPGGDIFERGFFYWLRKTYLRGKVRAFADSGALEAAAAKWEDHKKARDATFTNAHEAILHPKFYASLAPIFAPRNK